MNFDDEELFLDAIEQNDINIVTQYVNNGMKLDIQNYYPIYLAVEFGHDEIFKFLFDKCCLLLPINIRYELIQQSIEKNNYNIFIQLFDHIFPMNFFDILILVCENKRYNMLQYILENEDDELDTIYDIFDYSIINFDHKIFKLLYNKLKQHEIYININKIIRTCATLIHDWKKVIFLHKKGANIHFENGLILKSMIKYSHFKCVQYLCENGMDVYISDDDIYLNVIISGNFEMMNYLSELGMNKNMSNDQIIETCILHNNFDMLKYFIEDCKYTLCNEYLIYAFKYDNFDMVKYLIEKGVLIKNSFKELNTSNNDITDYNTFQNNIVYSCIHNNNFELLKYIFENEDIKINNVYYLNIAVLKGNSDVFY